MAAASSIGCPKFEAPPEGLNEETFTCFDDDILSTSVFEEIVGSSEAICCVTAQVLSPTFAANAHFRLIGAQLHR